MTDERPDDRPDLRADCSRCVGLCCVVPAFSASVDFAIDKPAGTPCPNLRDDFRCGIHSELRERGFRGCVVYDCFGAGQHVTQGAFEGRDWHAPEVATAMFASYRVMRQLHELLWYLTEASALRPSREVDALLDETRRMTDGDADALAALDVEAHWDRVNETLVAVSAEVRGRGRERRGLERGGLDRRGADLMGKDLRRTDLRGANLRGAYLIAADLRGADLARADLIGADLRDADLRGADLRNALFVTQPQVESARGDGTTRLPATLRRPAHWTTPTPSGRPR